MGLLPLRCQVSPLDLKGSLSLGNLLHEVGRLRLKFGLQATDLHKREYLEAGKHENKEHYKGRVFSLTELEKM